MIDTTIISDGGPGPYSIGKKCIDSSSITIEFPEKISALPWLFISECNSILFSAPIDSGFPIKVKYISTYHGVPKISELYPKIMLQKKDTLSIVAEASGNSIFQNSNENLSVSGYKSIGVSVGSYGQMNLEQGLDVRIGGEIRPGTEISAHLSDQGSSLDGATREISEFDMIYITLTDPKFSAVAGDQYIQWPLKGILSSQKKIKGLSVEFHPGSFSVQGFGALSGGMHTSETWKGKTGVQGPYVFKGKGESNFIIPIGGTVKVEVNGKSYQEGVDNDYVVDYDLGTVTFTPRVLIKDDDIIKTDYEYKLFDYQRTLFGTRAEFSTNDSIFSVKGVLWSEADNKNHPIELTLDSSEIGRLRTAGDKAVYGSSDRAVLENDVASENALYPLYEKINTPEGIAFRYKPYNPDFPEDRNGRYTVWFTPKNGGDYIRDDSVTNRVVYKYIGTGQGNYSAQTEIPAPKRLTTGELVASLNLKLLQASVDVAGQAYDRNLQSSIDDKDNLSSSALMTLSAGKKRFDKPSVWLNGNYKFLSKGFDRENINRYEQLQQWDDSTKVETNKELQVWDAVAGFTPLKGISAEIRYGQNRDSVLVTEKVSSGCRLQLADYLLLQYDNTIFTHHRFNIKKRNKNELSVLFSTEKLKAGIIIHEEWAYDTCGSGEGLVGTDLRYELQPLNLQEKVSFNQYRSGDNGLMTSTDTGFTITWEQSLDHQILPWWKVTGSTSYLYSLSKLPQSDQDQKTSTLLMNLQSTVEPSRAFMSNVKYTLSSEKKSNFIQVPIYAGKGLGTHIYVDSEYVPSVDGDYFIQQKEVYDSTGLSVRKACLDLNWSGDPQKKIKGILNDLIWSGTLRLDEHVDNRVSMLQSWLPGLVTLRTNKKTAKNEMSSSYADLSYRQDIQWEPEAWKNLKGKLSGTIFLKKIRSYQEPGWEGDGEISAQRNKITSENEIHYLQLFHDDSIAQDYHIRDIYMRSTQRYSLNKSIEFYLNECLGWARQDDPDRYQQKLPFDSCLYTQIHPGILFKINEKGTIEGSYELSNVTVPGDLDYRVARGFESGLTHVLNLIIDIQVGTHISITGSYRGEFHRESGVNEYEKSEHTANIEMKAFL